MELLVVISVIGVLVALLLPAIQSAREAGRRAQCADQLKQLGLGALNHESTMKFLPTGGWGWKWTGDPDRGYGLDQPGGWYYNLLEFIEEGPIRSLGEDGQADKLTSQQQDGTYQAVQVAVPWFMCPSRRGTSVYPLDPMSNGYITLKSTPSVVGRNDYAANTGDRYGPDNSLANPGPDIQGDQIVRPDVSIYRSHQRAYAVQSGRSTSVEAGTGVVHAFSIIKLQQITDGASHTIFAGEKYIPVDKYDTGFGDFNQGNDQGWDQGWDIDNCRWTLLPPHPDSYRWTDANGIELPDRKGDGWLRYRVFGSAHPTGCQFVFVDGSVHTIAYDVDEETFRQMGNRSDN